MTISATPTLTIVMKPIDWVKPYPRNVKKHPVEQVERLAKLIKATGWDQPIVTDREGVIIKGHGRRLAAIHLGMTSVPVLIRTDLSDAEANASRIGDNAAVSLEFDTKLMQSEIAAIMRDLPTFDLSDMGLTTKEMSMMTEMLDSITAADSLIEDHLAEGDRAKAEDAAAVAAADAEEVGLAKVFGFAKITRSEQRVAVQFLALATDRHGDEDPKEALFSLMRSVVAAA